MNDEISRKVIVDEPTKKDLFHGKGHERTATSLAKAIKDFDGVDRAIGLDGAWGSGKSSVVEIAAAYLDSKRQTKDCRHHFFTFDIWKSQGAGFRRSFLEHFISWAQDSFPDKRSHLQDLEKDIRGRTREIETNNRPMLDWFGIMVLFVLPMLPIYYFWARVRLEEFWKAIPDDAKLWDNALSFLFEAPIVILLVFLLVALLVAGRKFYFNRSLGIRGALSSVLLVSSKQHQDHKVIQRVREVDPNDYEFHRTLRDILATIQSDKDKVVLVLDNIDRLPREEIKEYWALVRSIFSRTHQAKAPQPKESITAIVPYDRSLIEDALSDEDTTIHPKKSDDDTTTDPEKNVTSLLSRELFSKTFDEVLTVSPPVLSNARDFFAAKLEEALPKMVPQDDRFRTYRIFVEVLRKDGGITTPRQVVSFVNEVSGLFVLHDAAFCLPTVAAFLAHQDVVTKTPEALNKLSNLNPKIVELASDPDIAKNLAAMVFNVDADLAFQVLLDEPLAAAMVADDAAGLKELISASGFELRADDVIKSNIHEWVKTSDYRRAIQNFADILPSYDKAAKPHIILALIDGFELVDSLTTETDAFEPYLRLFEFAPDDRKSETLSRYLDAGFEGVSQPESDELELGKSFAKFLDASHTDLIQNGLGDEFIAKLNTCAPGTSSDFLFGLAVGLTGTGLNFTNFESVRMSPPKEGHFHSEIATEDPVAALQAFRQFKKVGILKIADYVEIANACLTAAVDVDQDHEGVASLLEIVWFVWATLPEKSRAEIEFESALSEGQFFRNVGSSEDKYSERAVAIAFLLAAQTRLGNPIGAPTKLNPANNARAQDASDEFSAFNELITGQALLSDTQVQEITDKTKALSGFTLPWLHFGKKNPDHKSTEQVIISATSMDKPPFIALSNIVAYFTYLEDLIGSDKYVLFLTRMASSITANAIEKLELEKIPAGFLTATHKADGDNWTKFHDHVENELKEIGSTDWTVYLNEMGHTADILRAKIATSGCELESAKFRDPFISFILKVLSGVLSPKAADGFVDNLVDALGENYRSDIWRTVREKLADVSPKSLNLGHQLFPDLLADIATSGSSISAQEKDNVLRHILCTALEAPNQEIIDSFLELGARRIGEFKRAANESTVERLIGAVTAYSEAGVDQTQAREVSEKVLGKRRTRTLFSAFFGLDD